jgi:HK97 family phage prohead protease
MTAALARPVRPETRMVYREDLIREVGFALRDGEAGAADDGLTVDGYGAVFGQPTHISSWEGDFDEVIRKGAFRKSLRERTPVMQYDHGRHPLIGSIPLGRWDEIDEDDHGLHVVGRLSDNWLIQPVRDAIAGPDGRGGGIKGMSFRFSVVADEWTDKDGKRIRDDELLDMLWYGAGERGPILRTLKEVKVSEVGPVAWPAYEQTSVGVRSGDSPFVLDLGRLDVRTPEARNYLAVALAAADRCAPRPLPERERTIPPAVQAAREKFREQFPDAVDTQTSNTEPQATARPAAPHAVDTAPQGTGDAAGTHSPNPPARTSRAAVRDSIRARMLRITREGK